MTCVQAESDSGISVNLSHFDPDLTARAGQRHGDRDTGQWAHLPRLWWISYIFMMDANTKYQKIIPCSAFRPAQSGAFPAPAAPRTDRADGSYPRAGEEMKENI